MLQPNASLSPSTLRETFEHFRFYRRDLELEGLFTGVDFTDCTARQVFNACHGRCPGDVMEALAHTRFTGRDLFVAAVCSMEFQTQFASRFLAAFPEKPRSIFIHIPKSAGSDMSTHLIGRYASLNTKILDSSITDISSFHSVVKDISLEILAAERIYIHGHTTLNKYTEWKARRFSDEIFTIIRDPVEQIISQINYVLTRIFSNEFPVQADTSGWRNEFEIKNLDDYTTVAAQHELATQILHHDGVVPANVICEYLGRGTAKSAIEQVAIHNVEITDLAHYHHWLQSRWNINHFTKLNASTKFVSLSDFSPRDIDYINHITLQDQIFYNHVQGRLAKLAANALTGLEILNDEIFSRPLNV
jgi:hypothetical protein